MTDASTRTQPGPLHPSLAWAKAWGEMEAVLFRAIDGWRQFPGAENLAPLSVGPLSIACRIEAFAAPLPGLTWPAVEWRAGRETVSRSQVVELIAQQIRAGHQPNHGGGSCVKRH